MPRYNWYVESSVRIHNEKGELIDSLIIRRNVAVALNGAGLHDIVDDVTKEQSEDLSRYTKTVFEHEKKARN
jgi:hypothetical protein